MMLPPDGVRDADLGASELSQLDALASEPDDDSVPDEPVPSGVEVSAEHEVQILRKIAVRFLVTVDAPLSELESVRPSLGSEPTTFLDLVIARERAARARNGGAEGRP